MTIDSLLSSDDLILAAQDEQKNKVDNLCSLIFGVIDILAIMLIFLPLYGVPDGDFIRSVPLFYNTNSTHFTLITYWVLIGLSFCYGIVEMILPNFETRQIIKNFSYLSITLQSFMLIFFILSIQTYASVYIFTLLVAKIFFYFKLQ